MLRVPPLFIVQLGPPALEANQKKMKQAPASRPYHDMDPGEQQIQPSYQTWNNTLSDYWATTTSNESVRFLGSSCHWRLYLREQLINPQHQDYNRKWTTRT